MSVVECPFCFSKNNKKIVYNDSIKPKNTMYAERCNVNRLKNNDAILSNIDIFISEEYDGSFIRRKSYDRFCLDCGKSFYLISNLIINDIKYFTFIIETKKEKWKYALCFERDNSYYNYDHNYITKSNLASLTPARKFKIQDGIKKSNLLKWNALYGNDVLNYNIMWSVYVEFNNGQVLRKSGKDSYPEEWELFITPFIKVFKNEIFKKMKK